MENNSASEINKNRWRKFFSNKLALAGAIYIVFSCLIAIPGYLIIPDKTPNANQQFLELSALRPGSKILFVRIPKNEEKNSSSWLKTLVIGKKSDFQYIPIKKYEIKDTAIFVEAIGLAPLNIRNGITPSMLGIHRTIDNKQFKDLIENKYIIQRKFYLGTDRMGRDMLSRLVIGSRISMSVGLVAVLISLIIGVLLGSLAGYFKGWIDNVIMWLINVTWSIPTLLLVLCLSLLFKKGFYQIFIAVGLTMWVDVARIVRGQILSIREKEFVEAARALGYGNFRILRKHILPFTIAPLIIISAENFASAILIESGLSFLGLGIQPPVPSWGQMIKEHSGYLLLDKAYLAILPGIAIMLLTLAFIYVGNGLRDALDVKAASVDIKA
jgi:peptide/nickel transport system permease protein